MANVAWQGDLSNHFGGGVGVATSRLNAEDMLPRATWIPGGGRSDPGPEPTPTPTSPFVTPVATPRAPATPTASASATRPAATGTSPFVVATPAPPAAANRTESATATPSGTATPWGTPEWLGWTATPRSTSVPGAAATAAAEVKLTSDTVTAAGDIAEELAPLARSAGSAGRALSGPNPYQVAAGGAAVLRVAGRFDEEHAEEWSAAADLGDSAASGLVAYQAWKDAKLPSGIQVLRQASQAASVEGSLGAGSLSFIRRITYSVGEQVKAIASYVVSPRPLLRAVQGLGAAAGVVGGLFQAKEGIDMFHNSDKRDDVLGAVQFLGGVATTAGSAITVGATLGLVSAPLIVGMAPILLGIGAIAALGVGLYALGKKHQWGEKLQARANKPGGFSDSVIAVGRGVKAGVDALKAGVERVKDGLGAYSGIAANAKAIVQVAGEKARGAVANVANGVKNFFGRVFGGSPNAAPAAPPRPTPPRPPRGRGGR